MLFVRLLLIVFLGLHLQASDTVADDDQFVYSGFRGSGLTVDGTAAVTSDGLLQLTNGTAYLKGHAFHPTPLRLRDSANGTVQSFSVAFVFGIVSVYPDFSAHGMAFLIAPGKDFSSALPAKYLGLTNVQNNGNASNHLLAVELDTIQSVEFKDINANHVGIDVNGLQSLRSYNAGYYDDESGEFQNLKLISRQAMKVWVDYSGEKKQINVTLAPLRMATRSVRPLLSVSYDLSTVLTDLVYLGFSSATGRVNSRHCVLGWSFDKNRPAPATDVSKLPDLPRAGPKPPSKVLEIVLPIVTATLVLGFGGAAVLLTEFLPRSGWCLGTRSYARTGRLSLGHTGSRTRIFTTRLTDSRISICSVKEVSGGFTREFLSHLVKRVSGVPRIKTRDEGVRCRDSKYRPHPAP